MFETGFDPAIASRVGGVKRFEELISWQLAVQLCDCVFEMTAAGPAAGDLDFRHQIRAAAASAPALIAEGFARWTPGEFARYLRMARGELAEVQNHLHFAGRHHYCDPDTLEKVETLARRTQAATTALLRTKLPKR